MKLRTSSVAFLAVLAANASAQLTGEVLTSQAPVASQRFGAAIAAARLSPFSAQEWMLVGSPHANSLAGIVECFPPPGSGLPTLTLTPPSAHVQAGARFGSTIVVGDFNGDGFADVAVGAPDHDAVSRGDNVGRVFAFFGPWTFTYSNWCYLEPSPAQRNLFPAEPGNRFGATLAAGDLDLTLPFDDLAVGSPMATFVTGTARRLEAGAADVFLNVFPNGGTVPLFSNAHVTDPASLAMARDHLGTTLAIGEFASTYGPGPFSPLHDLAVGVPDHDVTQLGTTAPDFGGVRFFLGHLNVVGTPIWDATAPYWQSYVGLGWSGAGGAGHNYGIAIAATDYDADGWTDLAIGAPGGVAAVVELAHGSVLGVWGTFPNDVLLPPSGTTGVFGANLLWLERGGSSVPDLALSIVPDAVIVHRGTAAPGTAFFTWPATETHVSPGPSPVPPGTGFGMALARAARSGTGLDELAIGAPRMGAGGRFGPGVVYVRSK